jgi:hypothetical protein
VIGVPEGPNDGSQAGTAWITPRDDPSRRVRCDEVDANVVASTGVNDAAKTRGILCSYLTVAVELSLALCFD